MKNAPFYASLHARGLVAADLARAIGSSRAHVCLVLNNTPGRGHYTRRKLAGHLTERERRLLGWGPSGQLFPVECSKRLDTPILDAFRCPSATLNLRAPADAAPLLA